MILKHLEVDSKNIERKGKKNYFKSQVNIDIKHPIHQTANCFSWKRICLTSNKKKLFKIDWLNRQKKGKEKSLHTHWNFRLTWIGNCHRTTQQICILLRSTNNPNIIVTIDIQIHSGLCFHMMAWSFSSEIIYIWKQKNKRLCLIS